MTSVDATHARLHLAGPLAFVLFAQWMPDWDTVLLMGSLCAAHLLAACAFHARATSAATGAAAFDATSRRLFSASMYVLQLYLPTVVFSRWIGGAALPYAMVALYSALQMLGFVAACHERPAALLALAWLGAGATGAAMAASPLVCVWLLVSASAGLIHLLADSTHPLLHGAESGALVIAVALSAVGGPNVAPDALALHSVALFFPCVPLVCAILYPNDNRTSIHIFKHLCFFLTFSLYLAHEYIATDYASSTPFGMLGVVLAVFASGMIFHAREANHLHRFEFLTNVVVISTVIERTTPGFATFFAGHIVGTQTGNLVLLFFPSEMMYLQNDLLANAGHQAYALAGYAFGLCLFAAVKLASLYSLAVFVLALLLLSEFLESLVQRYSA